MDIDYNKDNQIIDKSYSLRAKRDSLTLKKLKKLAKVTQLLNLPEYIHEKFSKMQIAIKIEK